MYPPDKVNVSDGSRAIMLILFAKCVIGFIPQYNVSSFANLDIELFYGAIFVDNYLVLYKVKIYQHLFMVVKSTVQFLLHFY